MPVFVDTNVLVYARDASEAEKQPQATAWMDYLWSHRQGRVSFQVLDEYYVTVTRKLDPGLTRDEARQDVRDLLSWRPVAIEGPVVKGAWTAEDRYGFSFWDALVVSAAQLAGCDVLLTEDLSHGQRLDGLEVVNPFLAAPPAAAGSADE